MSNDKDKFTILDRSVGLNGPSMGLGAFFMIAGVTCVFIGLGLSEIKAILCGLVLLALSAFLLLSVNCIAINYHEKVLWLYKDYFITTSTGEKFPINEFTTVCIYYEITGYDVRSKSFSVALISKSGEQLVLKESGNINLVKKLQQRIAKETGLYLQKEPIRERD